MVIDSHVHFSESDGYADRLAEEYSRLGVVKACLLGGSYEGGKITGGILDAMKKYPHLYLGFGMLKLGDDHPDAVVAFKEAGFTGLKCIRPRSNYDDKAYYRLYEKAEELGMPILFHLGIVARGAQDKFRDTNNDRMRPVHLDTIARAFQDLTIIGAHFGNPWSDEAAMIARWNPNIFFDMSGSLLKYRPPEYFKMLLWWGGGQPHYKAPDGSEPWEKILFGSDVGIDVIEDVMNDYKRTMDAVGLDDEMQQKVWYGTAARILKIEPAS